MRPSARKARELAAKLGVEIKQIFLTAGKTDLHIIIDTPNGDNMAKFALAPGMQGNLHTRTARAWTSDEVFKLVAEPP